MGNAGHDGARPRCYFQGMKNHRKITLCAAAALLALGTCAGAQAADACRTVHDAFMATLNVPGGLRQYVVPREGVPERLMSVVTRDKVYVTLGGGHWDKEPRSTQLKEGLEADHLKQISDCRSTGTATVSGESTTVYEYQLRVASLPPKTAKAWIGGDGLMRKQSSAGTGYVRYEYKDVRAPE